MGDKSVRSGREGGMRGMERPEVATRTQRRGQCPPESRAGDQPVMAVGEGVGHTSGKVVAVDIRKTLRL